MVFLRHYYNLQQHLKLREITSLARFQDQDSIGAGFDETQAFVGSLDELNMLNKILSQHEITQIYKAGRIALSTVGKSQGTNGNSHSRKKLHSLLIDYPAKCL